MPFTKTQITTNAEARWKMLRGADIMADAVSSTLGPISSLVAIAKATPKGEVYERVCLKDGVSVARAIELEDEDENMGAQLLKQASQKQVDQVGDGTTAVMILAQAILHECSPLIETGVKAMTLRRGLEEGTEKMVKELERLAIPMKTKEQSQHIATISSEDEELGILVANAVDKMGVEGVIAVEESKNQETSVEFQEGMQFDQGYAHPYFVTNPERMEAVLDDGYILVTDKPIYSLVELQGVLNQVLQGNKKLVVMSPEFGTDALSLFLQNKMDGKLLVLCIKAPSFGENQKNILQDIALLTGAKYVTEAAGHSFEDVTLEDLGRVESITSTKSQTILSAGKENKYIKSRITALRKLIKEETSDFDKSKLEERLAKLTSGVCVIKVGGQTEVEMKERRERVLDAVAATTAAQESGIVPGGEVIYLQIRNELGNSQTDQILYKALEKPFTKLIENAGLNAGQYMERVLHIQGKIDHVGVNVMNGELRDMIREGIIDPVAVPINALRNAVSVSIQIMTSNVVITPIIKEEK